MPKQIRSSDNELVTGSYVITAEQKARLEQIASNRRLYVSQVMREILDSYFNRADFEAEIEARRKQPQPA